MLHSKNGRDATESLASFAIVIEGRGVSRNYQEPSANPPMLSHQSLMITIADDDEFMIKGGAPTF